MVFMVLWFFSFSLYEVKSSLKTRLHEVHCSGVARLECMGSCAKIPKGPQGSSAVQTSNSHILAISG